jgi:hypothetical protein
MKNKIKYLEKGAAEKSRDHFTKVRNQKPSREDVFEILKKRGADNKKPSKKIARRNQRQIKGLYQQSSPCLSISLRHAFLILGWEIDALGTIDQMTPIQAKTITFPNAFLELFLRHEPVYLQGSAHS